MNISGYTLDFEQTLQIIREKNYKTIAVQIPEGLKQKSIQILKYLETQTKACFIVLADPCYGACDIPSFQLKNVGIDCVIHIGHTPIPSLLSSDIPIFFINAISNLDVTKVVEKALRLLQGKRIGVVTTAQHLHTLNTVREILTKHNLEPIISNGDTRVDAKGQILGCDFTTATNISDVVDSFLFIGSGMFHPVGLLLATKKPVIAADPYTNSVKKQELDDLKDTILRQRYGAIATAKTAKTFGILLGLKPGQKRLNLTNKLKELIESKGKHVVVLAVTEFSPELLQSFLDIDCFVSTSCPRIAIDDYSRYKKPLLTPVELEIVLDKKSWDEYVFDQILD